MAKTMKIFEESWFKTGILEFSEEEVFEIEQLANNLTNSPYKDDDNFCKESQHLAKLLPKRISNILQCFAKYGSSVGFLLCKTVGVQDVETPPNNTFFIGETTRLSKIQSILMSIMCELIAYEGEGYGRIFQDIVPTKKMEFDQTSLSSNIELEIHTEQAFSNLRPDILSLACLKSDIEALTYIFPIAFILENMTAEEIETLYQPLWKIGVDSSFKLNGNEFIEGDIRGPIPILHGENLLVFDQNLMIGQTDEASRLMNKIIDLYYKFKYSHNLLPGEIIFLDNNRSVHGRSPFVPKYNGTDRFLIRCFGVFDYEKSEYARKSGKRTVGAIYS
jgi:hypothetical protein